MTSNHAPDPAVDASHDGPLTIAQIADRAGVSIATVSKVVNGRGDVASDTRERIQNVIDRYGYRRQKRASGPTALLELVFHELRGLYGIELLNGVHQVAQNHHLGVVVSELGGENVPNAGWLADVLARRPSGVIAVCTDFTDEQREQLRSRSVPFVLVDPPGEPDPGVPSVGANNWSGGLAATRHLLRLGHRRVAVITGPDHALSGRARLDGYRTAMDMAGIRVDPALVRKGDFQIDDGLRHTRELLALSDPPTAIFACNDGEAIGVYQAAAEAGWRIPDDLSVVGFDDLPASAWNIPPLTTIRHPLREMASAAANMLITLTLDKPLPQRRIELATELIIRNSTATPRDTQPD